MGPMFIAGCIDWEGPITGLKKHPSSIGTGHMERGGALPHRTKHTHPCCLVTVVKGVTVVAFLKVQGSYDFQEYVTYHFMQGLFSIYMY